MVCVTRLDFRRPAATPPTGEYLVQRDVSALMREFVTRKHRAVTIAQRIAIGTLVADARIIDATAEAAAWYDMADPAHLIGQWISLLHHPDDAQLGRELSVARHLGLQVPTRYVSRIWQAHAPGTFRPVLKDTTQIRLGTETYWVTVLAEPTEPPLALQPTLRAHWHLPPSEDVTRFCGQMSVAEMETLLRDHTRTPFERSHISDTSISQKSRHATTALDSGVLEQGALLFLTPGQTYRMPTGRYIHWCKVCGNLWRSDEAMPIQCGHRRCHSPHWQTGRTPRPSVP
jgi:hypothetical protein